MGSGIRPPGFIQLKVEPDALNLGAAGIVPAAISPREE
jgi:hypothetical protein